MRSAFRFTALIATTVLGAAALMGWLAVTRPAWFPVLEVNGLVQAAVAVLLATGVIAGAFAIASTRAGGSGAVDAELRKAQAELVNSARLATLGTLIAGVAHEINTPLGAIHSNHDVIKRALAKLQDILADEQVDPSELDEVRRIVKAVDRVLPAHEMAVERMVDLVASLRTFGRPDRSEIDRVDVHAGLESALALLRHKLEGRIEVKRDFGDLPEIECYPNQLNQVFMNLLLNACQAIPRDGRVTVRTRRMGKGVAVEIADDGPGMEPEVMSRIFEPGFTTKGSRMGMGLGLLISRQIVERHGGRIDVDSAPGQGARFTVSLPGTLPENGA